MHLRPQHCPTRQRRLAGNCHRPRSEPARVSRSIHGVSSTASALSRSLASEHASHACLCARTPRLAVATCSASPREFKTCLRRAHELDACPGHVCASSAPAVRQQCASSAPAVRQQCASSAPAVRQQCASSAPAVRQQCTNSAPAVRQQCASSAPAVRQQCASKGGLEPHINGHENRHGDGVRVLTGFPKLIPSSTADAGATVCAGETARAILITCGKGDMCMIIVRLRGAFGPPNPFFVLHVCVCEHQGDQPGPEHGQGGRHPLFRMCSVSFLTRSNSPRIMVPSGGFWCRVPASPEAVCRLPKQSQGEFQGRPCSRHSATCFARESSALQTWLENTSRLG